MNNRKDASPSPNRGRVTILPLAASALAIAFLTTACATPLPRESSQRALYLDLERVVEARETISWYIDKFEVEAAAPQAMRSTCRTSPTLQLHLEGWIDEQIEDFGGEAATQYKDGEDLDDLGDVLTLERIRAVLRFSRQNHDDLCPFYIEREDPFTGVHADTARPVVLLESLGGGALIIQGDKVSVGGGGAGRLLVGYGVREWLTLAMGAEVGGNGAISEADGGEQDVAATIAVGVPVLIRFISRARIVDIDIAAVNLGSYTRYAFNPGFRIGLATGLMTVRTGMFMPTGTAQISYEFHPEGVLGPPTHFLRIGSRFGINVGF